VIFPGLVIGFLLGRCLGHDEIHRDLSLLRIPDPLVSGTLMRDIGLLPGSMTPLAPSGRLATVGRAPIPPPRLPEALGSGLGAALGAAVALTPITLLADHHGLPAANAVEAAMTLDFSDDPDLPPRGVGCVRTGP